MVDAWLAPAPGFAAFVVGCAIALLVLFAAPSRLQNRLLAAALLFEAVAMLTFSVFQVTEDFPTLVAAASVNHLTAALVTLLYLAFLGTLDSPLTRPLRAPPVRAALVLSAVALVPLWPALHDPAQREWSIIALGAVMVAGLLVTLTAYLRAKRGTLAHRQAGIMLAAFGFRDLAMGPLLLGLLPEETLLPRWTLLPIISLLFFLMIGYAVLSMSLFDIDLRVKRGLRRSTVAAAFIGVFFVATTILQEWLSDSWGVLVGGAISGLLLLGLAPLQKAAQKLADHALPGVADTPEYVGARKRDVYRAALEGALMDGEITAKERHMLTRLQLELGIANVEARAMEDEVQASAPT